MQRIAQRLKRSLFPGQHTHSSRLTDAAELQALLTKLRPMCTDKELIRLGPVGDGGYLVPDDLVGIEACFSPGVGVLSGFEKECADSGMRIFLADGSVEQPAESHQLFRFTKKYIGALTNERCMTIDSWVEEALPDTQGDLLLQMDIEGSEYEVLFVVSENP